MLLQAPSSAAWRDRLAVLGGAAVCVLAAKAARVLWLRAQLHFGPVLVSQYKGQWALVTGGSEGLGKATATALARQGLNIILVSRSQAKLDAAAADIRAKHPGVEVRTMTADLSQPNNVAQLLKRLKGTPIRVLVANTGGGVGKGFAPYWEYTQAEEDAVGNLNGPSCYILTRGLLPGMVAAGSGAVVGISSVMSKLGIMAAPYGAEKAKINALMESIDGELKLTGNSGVTAQAMVIGAVATPAIAKLLNPSLRSAGPEEVAAAVAKLDSRLYAPADAVGEAVVRAIGRVGPVVTPHWRHALNSALLVGIWWPPSLQRAVQRRFTGRMMEAFAARTGTPQGGAAAASPTK